MSCRVCALPTENDYCADCVDVRELVGKSKREELILIVDGAFNNITKAAGVGLVLARESDESVVATGAISLTGYKNSVRVETQAILRGAWWAPGVSIWSDCTSSIALVKREYSKERGISVRFIPDELRDPLHNLAHRLANVGLHADWERYERLWIPGEVW